MMEAPVAGEVAKEGDLVTLRCSAQGYPTPQFTWTPSGQEVGPKHDGPGGDDCYNMLLPVLFPVPVCNYSTIVPFPSSFRVLVTLRTCPTLTRDPEDGAVCSLVPLMSLINVSLIV